MYSRTLILLFALLLCPHVLAEQELPAGYRFPNNEDRVDNWKALDKVDSKPYYIQADFNADNIQDKAWILIRKDNTGWGLFVFINLDGAASKYIKLDEYIGKEKVQTMAISIASPGEYITACGKGYWDCKEGEPKQITLLHPAISYFMYESASSFFYWDLVSKNFRRIWTSD